MVVFWWLFLIISYAYSEVLFTAPASASSTSSKEQIDNGLDEEFAKFCAAAKVSGRLGHIKKSDAKLRSVLTELSLAIEDNKHLKSAAEAMSKARGQINRAALLQLLGRPAIGHCTRGKDLRISMAKIWVASKAGNLTMYMRSEMIEQVEEILKLDEKETKSEQETKGAKETKGDGQLKVAKAGKGKTNTTAKDSAAETTATGSVDKGGRGGKGRVGQGRGGRAKWRKLVESKAPQAAAKTGSRPAKLGKRAQEADEAKLLFGSDEEADEEEGSTLEDSEEEEEEDEEQE